MPRIRLVSLSLSCCMFAACQPHAKTVESDPLPAVADAGTRRYTCDGGHRIAVTGATARVALADGRKVALPAAGTGAWRGEALSFVVTADRGSLSQHDVGAFLCMRAG